MIEWQPIATAPKVCDGTEIIGVRYDNGYMTKEPFLSFWSPSLGRFYCAPTHWMPLPQVPNDALRKMALEAA